MKNQKSKLLALMLVLLMYNCKDKDEAFPETPSSSILDEMTKVELTTVTITAPAAVANTPASVTPSTQYSELLTSVHAMASGEAINTSVTTAGTAMTSALTAAEISTLDAISPQAITTAFQTGVLPADLSAILTKAKANPAIAAYMAKFIFPTIAGVEVKGLRVGSTGTTAATARVAVEDACIAASEAAFKTVKDRLDASKVAEEAKITSAYNGWIALIAPAQAECSTAVTPTYTAYRTAAQTQALAFLADVELSKTGLGDIYPQIKGLVNLSLLDYLNSVFALEAADKNKCIVYSAAITTAAKFAQADNLAKVDANYKTALAQATELKKEAIESCHNQGGGN